MLTAACEVCKKSIDGVKGRLTLAPAHYSACACVSAAVSPPPPQVLTAACEVCKKSIEGAKGKLTVKEAARAVSERDDRLLAERMEALEAANREVSGVLNRGVFCPVGVLTQWVCRWLRVAEPECICMHGGSKQGAVLLCG